MNILTDILTKLGELLIEADTLLMEITVAKFDLECAWRGQFVAMSCVGLLLGACVGCYITFHILGGIK